jgi:hypothetical protein
MGARGPELYAKRKTRLSAGFLEFGSPGWIRTTECLSQSQVPYRLATGLWLLLVPVMLDGRDCSAAIRQCIAT